MIELKVYCDCGQKYKFDVEPVNGQMPFTVACPICRRDGTTKANELLQQMAVFKQVAPAPSAAPAPIAPPPPPTVRMRVNMPAPAAALAPPTADAPPPISARPRFGAAGLAAATATGPAKQTSFAFGLLGAFLGALVGATLYFLIYKTTGSFFLLRYVLALGVGGLAGWLANFLGKGEGSKELGGLAAVLTIIGIIAAQYFLELDKFHQNLDNNEITRSIQDGGYAESVKQAKVAVNTIPTGSDAEIRMYIAKQQTEDSQAPKLETISSDQVKQFRETELTNYQALASGQLTKEAYWAKNGFDPKAAKKIVATGENAVSGLVLVIAVLKAGIISMLAGAGLAFKLSANA